MILFSYLNIKKKLQYHSLGLLLYFLIASYEKFFDYLESSIVPGISMIIKESLVLEMCHNFLLEFYHSSSFTLSLSISNLFCLLPTPVKGDMTFFMRFLA